MNTPSTVIEARERARRAGFGMSSEEEVGRLLAVLAGAVRPSGRILEIGTGSGAGLAWIVSGLGARTDAEVHSVELDPAIHALAASATWPSWTTLHAGDVLTLLPTLGTFDLIFADAPGGKWTGLTATIAALTPGGLLLVDDMTPPHWADDNHQTQTLRVRDTLLTHPSLTSVELACSTGLILSTRR
ncbi:class I SAM-dependent methyltransferase [Actinoplanes sp. NPDC051851]|uniref:O-methyltransferase n=1 Tax=Actinoplanes sp. NPDC051851 TaxID=3154753 RepID=UPI00341A1DA0